MQRTLIQTKKYFISIFPSDNWKTLFLYKFIVRPATVLKKKTLGLQLYEKRTLAQVLSCEIREISKNTFFTEQWTIAFDNNITLLLLTKVQNSTSTS